MNGSKTPQAGLDEMELAVEAAEQEEIAAKVAKDKDVGIYTHLFTAPFTYAGRTYEKLTFDWRSLTGEDSLKIEAEMLRRGQTLVVPEYSGLYLTGMAAFACTERNEEGKRVVGTDAVKAIPLADFQKICKRARTFLLRAGS